MKPSILLIPVVLFLTITLVRAESRPAREELNQAAGSKAPAAVATPTAAEAQSLEAKNLPQAQLDAVVQHKATCPFIGTAVALRKLHILNTPNAPLASIKEVVALGNSGGGDLGEVLELFAQGNHAFMPGPSGALDQPVPGGLFSLDFPGSQGSHPGHSGILQGDHTQLGSGRFSPSDFARLTSRAQDGWIKRSDVGKFIGENLARDPNSKVFGGRVAKLLASDLHGFVGAVGPHLLEKFHGGSSDEERRLLEALTKATGEDNLVGSAGEFGLLFAFLAHEPGARTVDREPAVSVADLTAMFQEKRFPDGWDKWPKTGHDWVTNTTGLMIAAGNEYLRLKSR